MEFLHAPTQFRMALSMSQSPSPVRLYSVAPPVVTCQYYSPAPGGGGRSLAYFWYVSKPRRGAVEGGVGGGPSTVRGQGGGQYHILLVVRLGRKKRKKRTTIKPIFHWKWGSRWVPNANKIYTKNMKCTWPTPVFCVGTQHNLYSTDWRRGLANFSVR